MRLSHLFRIASLLSVGVLTICLGLTPLEAATKKPQRDQIAEQGPIVTQIGLQQDGETTSLIIDMSREVRAQAGVMLDPQRLLLDFAGARFHAPPLKAIEKNNIIKGLRFGAFMRGQGRIVLDLAQPANIQDQRFLPLQGGGSRLIVRLAPIPLSAFAALAKLQSDDVITGTTPEKLPSEQAELPLIVLDPGHGGIDAGASGANGEHEKTIVLLFAQALKERLEAGGKTRVLMTRSTDVFVPLRDRVRIARQAKAALFISLHADALSDEEDVRGASVYVLSERATDERAARLANKENLADLAAGIELKDDQDDVADILFDLARRESRAFSNQFARSLVTTLPKATRMHKTPLRGAGFRVLKAPDIPSVLLELGYLTSADEAKMMQSEEWRRSTADAAGEAVERFVADRLSKERDKP
jgi:N-acetylmuramoyl-L-alanine amidase